MGFGDLEGAWRVSSEERTLLRATNYEIKLSGAGEIFNPEVFIFPLRITVPFGVLAFGLSSYFRFRFEVPVLIVLGLIIAAILAPPLYSFITMLRTKTDRSMRAWLLAMTAVSCVLGYHAGEYLNNHYKHPYYDYQQLKVYKGIDTKTETGGRYADAGIVYFKPGTALKRNRNACLKNDNAYCVVPIVQCGETGVCGELDELSSTGSFDYWAVGKDCCGCPNGEFRCGDWDNPLAHAGLRLLNEDKDGLYYRLAVKQWEAMYGKKATNPLFFDWTLRPAKESSGLGSQGDVYAFGLTALFLMIQLCLSMFVDYLKII